MAYIRDWNGSFKQAVGTIGKKFDLCIEIGCFEGLTSNYIAENLLTESGRLLCIDPLTDSYLVQNVDENDKKNNSEHWGYFSGQYTRFEENTRDNVQNNKIILYRNTSDNVLPSLRDQYLGKVDFIYVDGDHRDFAVYSDAVNSFQLCKENGYILFDDYLWENLSHQKTTKKGIDRFLSEYSEHLNIIIHSHQVLVQKN